MNNSDTGADGINPRVVIGSLIIKHMCDLSDRETVQQIQENMYMQYFIGYSSFSNEEPFDPSLFVEFRKRLGAEQINAINEKILHMSTQKNEPAGGAKDKPPTQAAIATEDTLMPNIITQQPAADGKDEPSSSKGNRRNHPCKRSIRNNACRQINSRCHGLPARYKLSYRFEFTK